MAYTTINKSTDYFNTKLYTGTGSSQSVTGVGFQPDFTWIKQRSGTEQNVLFDAVRGVQKYIASNTTAAEATTATTLTAFNSDGFTEGGHGMTGANGSPYASWNWKAGGGQGSSNTDGSINTTYTSANTTAGFSISTYTGTGSAGTVGHGLGAIPEVVFVKQLNSTQHWMTYHKPLGNDARLVLSTNNSAATSSSYWNNTTPTSSTFSIGTNGDVNGSGNTYIAYCFAPKTGYSKFGNYVGNGQNNGTFIYTGFAPSFVLWKKADSSDSDNSWVIMDNKRSGDNQYAKALHPDLNNAESDYQNWFDIYSNGFKLRNGHNELNRSGSSYIYMAFGQSLVGSNNVPCTAR